MEKNDFQVFITDWRKNKGIGQKALAELLGVDANTVSQWERGVANPRYDTLVLVCRVLHVPVSALFPFDCVYPPAE